MFALEIKIDSLTLKSLRRSVARGKALELSNRRNVLVIAEEARGTQYDLLDGLARNLPDSLPTCRSSASPAHRIEKTDGNTRVVFGDYISIYDIQRAVADKATVAIYYAEPRRQAWVKPKRSAEYRPGIRTDHRRKEAEGGAYGSRE